MARNVKKIGERKTEKEDKPKPNASSALKSIMEDKTTKGDHYNGIISKSIPVSTGSLLLDSIVNITSGSVVRLIGKGGETGKTSSSFVLAENYMKAMPNSKTIFVKAEGRLSPQMMKRTGMKFVFSPDEWDYGTVFVYCGNIAETVFSMIERVLKDAHESDEHVCIIIDSLDGLILKDDAAKTFDGNNKVAGVPLITKIMFRRLSLPIAHYDSLLLVTGQYAADIKISQYVASGPRQGQSSGGSAIQHQSDYVLNYGSRSQADLIKEKPDQPPDPFSNKILGVLATVTLEKSADDTSKLSVKVPIKKGVIGPAIWKAREIVDMMIAFEFVKQKGSWFSFVEDVVSDASSAEIELKESIQGYNGLLEYLESDPNIMSFFEKKVREIITAGD